jgi:hypothetical protein
MTFKSNSKEYEYVLYCKLKGNVNSKLSLAQVVCVVSLGGFSRLAIGFTARCLSVITKREIADEHRHPTYNLDHALRARRLRWAGQLLRKEQEESLPTQVIIALLQPWLQHDLDTKNMERHSLLMDAPRFNNVEEAVEMAKDTHMWA